MTRPIWKRDWFYIVLLPSVFVLSMLAIAIIVRLIT